VIVYLLISDEAPSEAVDVYLRRDDAEAALRAALDDEPEWQENLHVEKAELTAAWSPN
jgi:hypothetical protein